MRAGIWFAGELPVSRVQELARTAEEAGLDSVWMAEGYYARDAWTQLGAVAAATERVLIGTGVVPTFTRHPALLAMSFATLDEMTGGRVIAGIGSGERNNVSDEMGYDFSRPLSAVRETVEIIRTLLAGERVDLEGRVFTARDIRLGFRPLRGDLPLYVAAVGPKMCHLVGRLAEGVYFPQASPRFVEEARERVAAGAVDAGRDPDAIDYAAMIICSVSNDPAQARNVARPLLAVLLAIPEGEHILVHNGLDEAGAQRIRSALRQGGPRAAAQEVTDDMVDVLAVAGTPEEVSDRLDALKRAGVTHAVLSAIGPEAEQAIAVAAAAGA